MAGWAFALAALQQVPAIISVVEQLLPGKGKSGDKKQAATSELTKYEGALALDQRVKYAKSALIDAQVEYLNAMTAAETEATKLGIPVVPFVTQALAVGQTPPPAPAPAITAVAAVGTPSS